MSDALTAYVTCPECGGELLIDPGEAKVLTPVHGEAFARCDRCLNGYTLRVSLDLTEPWRGTPRTGPRLEDWKRSEAAYHAGVTLEGMNG